jgi:hypothetical protein
MSNPVADLATLLRSMEPVLHDGVYVYATVPHDTDPGCVSALATFREAEGITLVLPEADAVKAGMTILFRAAWITLQVRSDLEAVGFTAAFSRALADAGIGCNVVAAAHHDHVFVPFESAQSALAALCALQHQST